MIIGTVRILPPPDRRAAITELLRSVQGPVRAHPGCAAFDVLDEQGAEPAIVQRFFTDMLAFLPKAALAGIVATVAVTRADRPFRDWLEKYELMKLVDSDRFYPTNRHPAAAFREATAPAAEE